MSKTISPQAALDGMKNGARLIDVRTPGEFASVHADGAELLPLNRVDELPTLVCESGEAPQIYIICRSGARAQQACQRVLSKGLKNVYVVTGGTDAWVRAGLPVVRGKSELSLERQAQMAIGAITLVGTLITVYVDPTFWFVPAFMGAGLLFAGCTGSCAMGMLIGKCPWNRRSS